jgi:hypothetical protein
VSEVLGHLLRGLLRVNSQAELIVKLHALMSPENQAARAAFQGCARR